jgi:hypothetical protein
VQVELGFVGRFGAAGFAVGNRTPELTKYPSIGSERPIGVQPVALPQIAMDACGPCAPTLIVEVLVLLPYLAAYGAVGVPVGTKRHELELLSGVAPHKDSISSKASIALLRALQLVIGRPGLGALFPATRHQSQRRLLFVY